MSDSEEPITAEKVAEIKDESKLSENVPACGVASEEAKFLTNPGPIEDTVYPIHVTYCGNCSMPVEYCEYYPENKKCKEWHEKFLADDMKDLLHQDDDDDGGRRKKAQKRGGKGMKKKKLTPQGITLSRAPRGKRKFVTVIKGLASYGIDLKDAGKIFGQRFACGASVTGDDEIVIQGDVKDDLFDFISEKWDSISDNDIEDLGDLKR